MKYLKRILGLPFFLMLNVIGMIFMLFKLSKAFILYGGEAVAYTKKNEAKTITDIYQQLKHNQKTNFQPNHQPIVEPDLVPYHTIGFSQTRMSLSKKYGVSRTNILGIIKGNFWKHL